MELELTTELQALQQSHSEQLATIKKLTDKVNCLETELKVRQNQLQDTDTILQITNAIISRLQQKSINFGDDLGEIHSKFLAGRIYALEEFKQVVLGNKTSL